jgi:transposase
MPEDLDCITNLLGIPGFRVMALERKRDGLRSVILLWLKRTALDRFQCSGCGGWTGRGVRYRDRVVQHLTLWHHMTFLRFTEYRVKCPTCGLKVEALPWVTRYARVTVPLAGLVAELCKVMTNKAVSLFQGLHQAAVKAIDKASMMAAQAARNLEGITALGFDEIAVGKGHNYWHMVSALEGPYGPELLFIGEGRKEKNVKGFWKWFGKERTARITHAVMDMWKGFINSVRSHCLNARIIYDKFHVIRHLLNALNKVRRQELLRAKGRFKGMLTGKKFILLSRQTHVRGKAREALNDILAFSKKLMRAHMLKESFGHLWSFKSKTWARKFFDGWVKDLRWTRLTPYHRFVKMVRTHFDGILAYCDKKLPLGFIEATNLKAKNIIRRAYGYRDKDYMKLKIIQACSHLGKFHPWNTSFNILQ